LIDRRRTAFWVLLISSLCAFALSMGFRWFERGGAFDLDTVRIRGIRKADSSVVADAVAPLFGTSIWQIDTEELRNELVSIPGIDSAAVRREPLRTMILELRVSTPSFAIVEGNGKTAVSTMGEILPDRFISDSLPAVTAAVPIGSEVSRRLAGWLHRDLETLEGTSLSFTERGLSVLVEGRFRVLLGNEDLHRRWASYRMVASTIQGREDPFEIDMRYSGQAVLRDPSVPGDDGEVVR